MFNYSFAGQRQTVILTGQYGRVLGGEAGIGPVLEFPHCHLVPTDKRRSKVPGDFIGAVVPSEMLL